MYRLIGRFFSLIERFNNKCKGEYIKSRMKTCGDNVYLGKECIFTAENISVGSHVYVAPKCVLQSAHGEIIIGNHVMLGTGVHIHGGNHIMNAIGEYMDMVVKEPYSDGKVVIDDDVWIGANSIVLKGVHIGEGAVVGAGSVVTKNVEPYSIVAGNPARKIRMRFTEEELVEHKKKLRGR